MDVQTHPYTSPRSSHSPMVSSPPTNCCPSASSNLRYEIVLEAPTAVAPKTEDSPLTYLNKGQYYNILLKDVEGYDGDITSTISIMFHDESHRKVAPNYWKFWISQQKHAEKARAVDIDPSRCQRIHQIETSYFDRAVFRWNGKAGAIISIRFNCLSTDFSRIKGVKGVPLRLHITNQQQHHRSESAFCRIKLFRDKGAERKNKDDARHIEKQLEKLQGKNGESHPLWVAYTQAQPCTLFSPASSNSPPQTPVTSISSPSEHYEQQRNSVNSTVLATPSLPTTIGKRPFQDMISSISSATDMLLPPFPTTTPTTTTPPSVPSRPQYYRSMVATPTVPPLPAPPLPPFISSVGTMIPSCPLTLDIDPTYIPEPRRRRIAKRCLFARFAREPFHRAIYLNELTVDDLKAKMIAKMTAMTMNSTQESKREGYVIKEVIRHVTSKEGMMVQVDDAMVRNMLEEQDMQVDSETYKDGTTTLILRY